MKHSLNRSGSSQIFIFFWVKNVYLTPKKLIKFTLTIAKKTEISQNTENFHPCMYDICKSTSCREIIPVQRS